MSTLPGWVMLLCAATTAAAEDLDATDLILPRDQTAVREERGEILSVSDDVRSPMIATMPGAGMHDAVDLEVLGEQDHLFYNKLPTGSQDLGREQIASMRLRVRLWGELLAWEAMSQLIVAHAADHYDIGNADTDLAIGLAQGRYAGVTLVLGAALPLGTGTVLAQSADVRYFHPGYLAGLRASGHLGMHVFHLNVGGRFTPEAYHRLPESLTLVDGTEVPGGGGTLSESNDVRVDAAVGWTWRLCRFERIGAEATGRYDHLRFTDGSGGGVVRITQATISAFEEIDPCRDLALKGTAGVQPAWLHRDRHASAVMAADLLVRF